jgi:3-mercaptopyruvate sulfurtransferase SseA
MKSFKAAKKSKLSNIKVFDAGVFEWSQAHPEYAKLLGEAPLEPSKLISKADLKKHFLPLSKFEELIMGSVLIDVRDKKQRRGNGLFLLADKSAPLDDTKKLERYIDKAIAEDKVLLAYDNSGKQVRWLQYHLENKGLKNYYFMKGGAKYYRYDDAK